MRIGPRALIVLFAIALLLAPFHAGLAATGPALRFAVIADQTGSAMPGVYDSVLAEVARLDPDFVLTVGDQVQGYTGKDTTLLRTEYEQVREQYDRAFGPRWRSGGFLIPTSGNHDITQDEAEPVWRRFFGPPTRRFDVQGVTVLVLDSSRPPDEQKLDEAQIKFLEREVPRIPRGQPILVVTHKPWFSQTLWRGKPDPAHELFKQHGNVTVLTGHWHTYVYEPRDGVTYVVCGSSGGQTGGQGLSNGELIGFIWGTVRDGRVALTPISLGNVHAPDILTAREDQIESAFSAGGITASPFDLGGTGAARVTVLARNPGDLASADSLVWSVPPAWRITPPAAAVTIPAGDSTSTGFDVVSEGNPFPIPKLTAGLRYGRGKRIAITVPLRVVRTARAPLAGQIRIDGRLDRGEWGTAPAESLFMSPEGGPSRIDPTRFLFTHDDRGIYLAARCATAPGHAIKVDATERDGRVSQDDCAGWFLSSADSVIYQIYVNPDGVIFDGRGKRTPDGIAMDYAWNGDVRAAATRDATGEWAVEVSLPYAALGIAPGALPREIRLNMRRKQPALGSAADWLPVSFDPRDLGILRIGM